MKCTHNKIMLLPAAILVSGFLFLSCQKKFDESSYMPVKPLGGYNSSNEIAQGSLVAYWSFDNTLTDSASGLTGTNTGTTFVTGKRGQAIQGDSSSYVLYSNPGAVASLKAYTISFWMNAPANTDYGYGVFSLNNSQDFWGSLDIYFDNRNPAKTGDSAIFKVHMNNGNAKNSGKFLGVNVPNPWNKWTQMVITYDSSSKASANFTIYANGSSVYSALLKDTSNNYGPLKFVNASAMVIGTWQFQTNPSLTTSATGQSWAGGFKGALDNFRIYNKPLSAADVSSLFKLESVGR